MEHLIDTSFDIAGFRCKFFSRMDLTYLLCISSLLKKDLMNSYPSKRYVFYSFSPFFAFYFLKKKNNSPLKYVLTIMSFLLNIMLLFHIIYALQAQGLFITSSKLLFIGCFFVNFFCLLCNFYICSLLALLMMKISWVRILSGCLKIGDCLTILRLKKL